MSLNVATTAEILNGIRDVFKNAEEWRSRGLDKSYQLLVRCAEACEKVMNQRLSFVCSQTGFTVHSVLEHTFVVISRALLEYMLVLSKTSKPATSEKQITMINGFSAEQFFPRSDVWIDSIVFPGVTGMKVIDPYGATSIGHWQARPRNGIAILLSPFNSPGLTVVAALHMILEEQIPVILKVSEKVPKMKVLYEELLAPFIEARALFVVSGDQSLGQWLIDLPYVIRVHLIGTERAAREISSRLNPNVYFTKEVGGITPVIVDPRVRRRNDIIRVARLIHYMANENNGQQCVSAQVVLVGEEIKTALEEELIVLQRAASVVSATATCDQVRYSSSVGPVIEDGTVDRYNRLVADAKSNGIRTFAAGEVHGRLIPPTMLSADRLDPERLIVKEEAFSPIYALMPVGSAANHEAYMKKTLEFVRQIKGDLAVTYITSERHDEYTWRFCLSLPHSLIGINAWPGFICAFGPWGSRPGSCSGDTFMGGRFNGDIGRIRKVIFAMTSLGRQGWYGLPLWEPPWLLPNNLWNARILEALVRLYLARALGRKANLVAALAHVAISLVAPESSRGLRRFRYRL